MNRRVERKDLTFIRSYLREVDGKYKRVRSHFRRERKGVAQVLNPKTDRWTLLDTERGGIISHKKSPGPYKNVRVYKGHDDGGERE